MPTVVEICNMALSNIRAGQISSLTEASTQANQCAIKYPVMRDMVLTNFSWNFARSIKPLALLSNTTVFNWRYVYQYPADCLRIDKLILNYQLYSAGVYTPPYDNANLPDLEGQVPYKVMTVDGVKVIVSNEPDLRIQYRTRVTDTTKYDTVFIMALSYLLASELAIPLAGIELGGRLRAESLQIYEAYISQASADNRNESYDAPVESEFITVRG